MKAINIVWDINGAEIEIPTEIDIPNGMTSKNELKG